MTIINDNARIVNKLDALLTDDARIVIYDRHMFIVQTTVLPGTNTVGYMTPVSVTKKKKVL